MKLLRYVDLGIIRYGKLENDDSVYALKSRSLFADNLIFSDISVNLSDIELLPPVIPSKIVAVGLNYKDHSKELDFKTPDFPVLFLKPPSSVLAPNKKILYPSISKQVDYEAELAFIIAKECRNIKQSSAMEYILGFTCFNDVTARDLQKLDGQWTRAKSFDTFSPFGPAIVTTDEFNPKNARIQAIVNGNIKQDSNIKNLIFDIPKLVEFISEVMTLYPGDIVTTGTPPGVGPLQHGDIVEIRIDGIGGLINTVS